MDFDWVTVRSKCAPAEVLKRLQRGAEEDVRIRMRLADAGARVKFSVVPGDGGFSVERDGDESATSVDFEITDHGIRAIRNGSVVIEATLILNDDGDCKLSAQGVELSSWQFRQRALEDLFFGS